MSKLVRSLERKRRNKKATRFNFRFVPKQLTLETDEKWCPDQITLVCVHRNRRFCSTPRRLESSCTIACRRLVVWPDSMVDSIDFETTLYSNGDTGTMDDKKWTLVLEGSMTTTKNGQVKHSQRVLASFGLSIQTLIAQPGHKAEMLLTMRPLHDWVKFCQVEMWVITERSLETSAISSPAASATPSPHHHLQQLESTLHQQPKPIPAPDFSTPLRPTSSSQQRPFGKSTNSMASGSEEEKPVSPELGANVNVSTGIAFEDTPTNSQDRRPFQPPQMGLSKSTDNDGINAAASSRKSSIDELREAAHSSNQLGQGSTPTWAMPTASAQRTPATLPISRLLDSSQFTNGHAQEQPGQHSLPPPASAPARDHHHTATLPNGFSGGMASPRLASSATKSRPVPPSRDEVQALVAHLMATKRPDLGPITPLTTRQQNGGNSHPQQLPRQTSISSALMEKARQMEAELQKIKQEIKENQQMDQCVLEKIPDLEPGSEQETELVQHHQRLVCERDQLSRREDFLNVQMELNETEFKIAHLRSMLAGNGTPQDEVDANSLLHDRRRDSSLLMLELKELMDHKEELTHQLSDMEAEDEEGEEHSRMMLERTRNQNFVRGPEEPFNMSKRLMGWISNVESRFKQ